MSSRPRVSLTLITRNEESQLRLCLEPVRDLVDEIIVVDTGSTDHTRQVAADLGARVSEFTWCDDFAAARNETLERATGDWVFWLDADDRIDGENRQRLQNLLASLTLDDRAYMMACISLPQYPVDPAIVLPHCRLFRRHPAIRWSRRVHEQILPAVERQGHAITATDIQIKHVGYRDPALVRRKANRDLRLLRLEYATNPTDPVTLMNLGLTHMRIGQHTEALTHLLSSLKHASGRGDWQRRLYAMIGDCLTRLGRREEAVALLADGLIRFPEDPGLATRRATLLSQMGDLGGAERCLLQLLRSPSNGALLPGEQAMLDRRDARLLLGMIYRDQGRLRDAERVFQELLAVTPDFVQAWVGLGYAYLSLAQLGQVEHVARQLEKCPCGGPYAAVMRAEGCMARGELAAARELLDQAIAGAPQMIWPRLVLSDWLIRSGAAPAACAAALRDVLRLDPGNALAAANLAHIERRERGEGAGSPGWFTITA
jgi:tetratricopeptide (TPR) repeat protein